MQVTEKQTLESFVRNELPDRLREIREIESVLEETLGDFKLCWNSKSECWPYSVVQDSTLNEDDCELSHSTNAMVLFMLETLVPENDANAESYSGQPVRLRTPLLARTAKFLRKHRGTYKQVRGSTIDLLTKRTNISTEGTKSGTFGPNDPLTLTWLLESGFSFGDPCLREIVKDFAEGAFDNPSGWRLNPASNDAAAHAFPLLRLAHFVWNLIGIESQPNDGGFNLDRDALDDALANFGLWFEARLHQHLSYSCIPDSTFDCAELVFSLEGLLSCDPHPEGVERLVGRVAEVLHQKQDANPNFRPYRPFVSNKQGLALLPLTVEVFASLLRVCERLETRFNVKPPKVFEQIINRYTRWLLDARQKIRVKVKEEGKQIISGWCSEHTHSTRVIHVWETSQVLVFLAHQARWRRKQLEQEIMVVANFTVEHCPALMKFMPEPDKLSIGYAEPCEAEPIFQRLYEGFIEPRTGGSREPQYSALLYGPPGTGKTTFAMYVAASLRRDLVMLSPSDFLVSGGERVEARAKAIFEALEVLEDKVILFDEIDRLVLDRQANAYREQSDLFQFMTPSMLPKLANLRSRKRSIFFVATNYFERIDPAIKRAGRIDRTYLVQLPDKRKRKQLIELALGERKDSLGALTKSDQQGETLGSARVETVRLHKKQSKVVLDREEGLGKALSKALSKALRLSLFLTIKELASAAEDAFGKIELSDSLNKAINSLVEVLEKKRSNEIGESQDKEVDDEYYTHLNLLGDISMEDYRIRMTSSDYSQKPKEERDSLVALIKEVYSANDKKACDE